MATMVPSP
jgi:hypothetical protein